MTVADSNETIAGRQRLSRMGLERSLLACQEELGAERVRAATAENSLEDATAEITALRLEVDRMRAEAGELKEQVARRGRAISDLMRTRNKLEQDLEDTRGQLEKSVATINVLVGDDVRPLSDMLREDRDGLLAEVTSARAEATRRATQVGTLARVIDSMRVKLTGAEASVAALRERVAALEAMYEDTSRFGAYNHERAERAEDALGRLAEKHNDLLARVASIWVKRPDPTGNSGPDRETIFGVTVERCQQRKGPDLWAVRCSGNVLSRTGEWEYEPMPSSRDAAFLERCRFTDLGYAIEMGKAAKGADEQ